MVKHASSCRRCQRKTGELVRICDGRDYCRACVEPFTLELPKAPRQLAALKIVDDYVSWLTTLRQSLIFAFIFAAIFSLSIGCLFSPLLHSSEPFIAGWLVFSGVAFVSGCLAGATASKASFDFFAELDIENGHVKYSERILGKWRVYEAEWDKCSFWVHDRGFSFRLPWGRPQLHVRIGSIWVRYSVGTIALNDKQREQWLALLELTSLTSTESNHSKRNVSDC